MKIYNYSDLPCTYKGSTIEAVEFHIPDSSSISSFGKYYDLKHNGSIIADENTDVVIISQNLGQTGYVYEKVEFPVPNISLTIGTMMMVFGFWFLIRIIQKVRLR